MPLPIETWHQAMVNVNLSKSVQLQHEIWGYWILEPGLLLHSTNPDHLHQYIFNWLHVCLV